MDRRPLILVGGGGHCKSVIDVAENAGYAILGVLDVPENVGKDVLAYKVLGTDDDIPFYVGKADFIVTVGFIKNPELRIKIHKRIIESGGRLATVISPLAHVSRYATIKAGTVVMHHAVINACAQVGFGCIINTFCNIEHDARIGDYCHISTGAMINGDCRVGANTFIGSQSVMVNGTSVPGNSVFAAASMIRKSLEKEGIYAGNPAVLMIRK